jgi:hypothetical protein
MLSIRIANLLLVGLKFPIEEKPKFHFFCLDHGSYFADSRTSLNVFCIHDEKLVSCDSSCHRGGEVSRDVLLPDNFLLEASII